MCAVHFTCPRCGRSHDRGYVDGVSLFRCLNCGYLGRGHHPDPEIDGEVQHAIDEANQWNAAHGLPLEETT
jgi:rubredoxin